jgi:hypothetical protein
MIELIADLGPGAVLQTARFMLLVVLFAGVGAEVGLRVGDWWDGVREMRFQRDMYKIAAEARLEACQRTTGELERIEAARQRHFTDPEVALRAYRLALRHDMSTAS